MEIYAKCYRDRLRRGLGLMLRRPRPILLIGVNSIHTFLMLEPIWAVFLDEEMRVVDVLYLKPWKTRREPRAAHTLELPKEERPPEKGDSLEIVCL
ncbi:MAG: hypothetical protein ACP5I3_02055 [Thermoproteus sp.]